MGASGERTIISPRRSPPDYTKRSVKLRIFAYLAVLILILSVWERSREPQAWNWLWLRDAEEGQKINPRMATEPLRTANDPAGTFVSTSPANAAGDVSEDGSDLASQAWEQAWTDVLARP